MFPNWSIFRKNAPSSTLQAIYLSPSAGIPMQHHSSAMAIKNRGIQGDRYCCDAGHWQLLDGCQVTLITTQELARAQKRSTVNLMSGEHRRNLVIEGIHRNKLENGQFKIDDAIFEYQKPRPPCGYIDRVSEQGMCKALLHNSGICIKVIKSGTLSVGDQLEIIT